MPVVEGITTAAIALLFFMHGAKLSREAIIAAAATGGCICGSCAALLCSFLSSAYCLPGGRLSMSTLCFTALSVSVYFCPPPCSLRLRLLSLAGGNVAAAVCSASASSLLGIFLSPLLVGLVMNIHGAQGSLEQVGKIMLQLLLPFVLGHLSRPWIGNWVARNKKWIAKTDQTSILLVVYSAFSEAVVNGHLHKVGWDRCYLSLWSASYCWRIVIAINVFVARNAASIKPTKSLLFSAVRKKAWPTGSRCQYSVSDVSAGYDGITGDDLPQIQLMVCAGLARRYKRQTEKLQAQQESRAAKA
ncbi:transporter, bile acid/Na+ symporter family [Salmonella enterica subsp. enterica serovar Sanjuan]|uniref:Transporter, bile acid/Na+ symporter family n=1 Tax=Salmonella enterica subsp. enterica serovar Sanjuan TaxID=1160765 RepID=A0A447NNK7_SALET|nr:transporter, bile acid/Na+ symporter family [Salmonella enterica subsp. enterica serovar Sanjuan]